MGQLTAVLGSVIIAQLIANMLLVRWIIVGTVKSKPKTSERSEEKKEPAFRYGGAPFGTDLRIAQLSAERLNEMTRLK